MKKKFMALMFSVIMASTSVLATAAVAAPAVKVTKAVQVTVNQKNVVFPDAKPYVESNRVLIPVRFVSEALGAKVDYKDKTVFIKQNGKSISMKVNSAIVTRDQEKLLLDVPARLQQDRVYVPLRFVSEALGATVDWNQIKYLVTITTGAAGSEVPVTPEKPDAVFKPFEWEEKTDLGKALFKNNMKYANGKLTFTVPEGTTATYYSGKSSGVKLKPGQEYSYPKGTGSISFSKIYAKEDHIEGYSVFLDTKSDSLSGQYDNLTNDVVVKHGFVKENKMVGSAGTLTEVISAAQSL